MSHDQFKILYQNRNCYQENIGGVMYKSGYGSPESIYKNRNGLKGFKLFAIENTKFYKRKKDTNNFLLNSTNLLISNNEFED